MAKFEARLAALGLSLPPPMQPPPGVALPFQFVRVLNRALVSGHRPQQPDGSVAGPPGKLGDALTVEQAMRRRGSLRCPCWAACGGR